MKIRHKFHAIRTQINGIKFGSKKEAKYYQELLLRKKVGEVIFFLRQVPFDIGANKKYYCDFVEFLANGMVEFIEVKGYKTPLYKLKKSLVESLYPLQIKEV